MGTYELLSCRGYFVSDAVFMVYHQFYWLQYPFSYRTPWTTLLYCLLLNKQNGPNSILQCSARLVGLFSFSPSGKIYKKYDPVTKNLQYLEVSESNATTVFTCLAATDNDFFLCQKLSDICSDAETSTNHMERPFSNH